jgi:hypothetical protein
MFFNVKETNDVALWSKPISAGAAQPVRDMPRLGAAESWTATVRGIYFTASSSTRPTINFYDFAPRTIQPLCDLPQPPTPGGGLSVSPGGRWVLYTQADDVQSDMMLANHFL